MYQKAYGIIETLAPLHIGASAGEETGNLNLIFRDQFTQTGIIPGSSIRGRFRADMRSRCLKLEEEIDENLWYRLTYCFNGADCISWRSHSLETSRRRPIKTIDLLQKSLLIYLLTGKMPVPSEKITFVGQASCLSYLFLQEV